MPDARIEEQIRRYLIEELGVTDEVTVEDRLVDRDFVASAELIDVVVFIEDTFGVVLRPVDVVPENLESIAAIAKVVRERLADAGK
jgi:acyl carrier protein